MKTLYISVAVIFSLFSGVHQIHAQSFAALPQPGAIYSEVYIQDGGNFQYEPANYSHAYLGDTLIGSYSYAKIDFYGFGNMSLVYTYFDNGRLYYHDSVPSTTNPTGGLLLYDFNLVVGDTFNPPATDNYGNYQMPLIVDLVDTITLLNSQARKHIRMTDGLNTLEWVEGLGDMHRGFFYVYGWALDEEILVCVNDSTGLVWEADMNFYCNPNDPIPDAGTNTCGIFSYTTSVYDQSCGGCDGVVSLTNVTGGVAPYTYTWSNAETGSFNVLCCLGQNIVTIHDANGDSCSQSYYVGWNLPDFTFSVDPYPCDGVDTVTIVPLSGIFPFVGNWYPQGTWAMSVVIDSSGEYWAMMRDNAFCGIWKSIDIVNVELLQATPAVTPISCPTCCDGNVNLNIAFGHPPYAVTSTPAFPAANSFCQGWYQYCITDSMGCTLCDSVYVPGVTSIGENSSGQFEVFPNPADESCIISRKVQEPATAQLTDASGRIVDEWIIREARTELNTSRLECGIYFLTLDGCTRKIIVNR